MELYTVAGKDRPAIGKIVTFRKEESSTNNEVIAVMLDGELVGYVKEGSGRYNGTHSAGYLMRLLDIETEPAIGKVIVHGMERNDFIVCLIR